MGKKIIFNHFRFSCDFNFLYNIIITIRVNGIALCVCECVPFKLQQFSLLNDLKKNPMTRRHCRTFFFIFFQVTRSLKRKKNE